MPFISKINGVNFSASYAATSSYVDLGINGNIGPQFLTLEASTGYPTLRGYRLSISGAASTTITGNGVYIGVDGGNTYLYGTVNLPVATYNITASQAQTASLATTASLASTASFLTAGTYQITSSRAINALTSSYFIGPGSATISDDGSNNLSIVANRVFITGSNSVLIRGDNNISLYGGTTVYGNLIPGSPYTNNTSSYNLGSSTAAWKDLYVSNGSINFISGSNSASISFTNGNIDFGGANLTIPSGSTVSTASFAVSASSANTASFAVSASFASTSSNSSTLGASLFQPAAGNLQLRNSNSTTISTITNLAASVAVTATSASLAATASFAVSASHLNNGFSFAGPGSTITGSVAISSSYGLYIPANTFGVGDIIKIQGVFTKPVSATSTSHYIYVNTSNQLSGATQMAIYNTTTTRWTPITRTFGIESSTRTTGYAAATSHYSDDIAIATGFATSSLNINWGVDQYILFAAQNATLADRTDTLRFFAKSI